MYKIRTYNTISVKGLDRFPRAQFEVGSDVAHPDAFLLRSQKLHDEPVPDTLLAAARAGHPSIGKQLEGGLKYQIPGTQVLFTAAGSYKQGDPYPRKLPMEAVPVHGAV